MQTTLLGLAIAFILALTAALVGPYFVDWNRFRPQFEAEASRVIGVKVRVEGALDARLLPRRRCGFVRWWSAVPRPVQGPAPTSWMWSSVSAR